MTKCQYIGSEQREWPFDMCGHRTLEGKSYCGDHYYVIYKRGSAASGRRAEKEVNKEIAELKRQQELEDSQNG